MLAADCVEPVLSFVAVDVVGGLAELRRTRTSWAVPSRASRRTTRLPRAVASTAANGGTGARCRAPRTATPSCSACRRPRACECAPNRCPGVGDRSGGCRRPTGRTAQPQRWTHSASAMPAPPPAAMPKALNPAPTKKFFSSGASPRMKLPSGVKLSGTVDQLVDAGCLQRRHATDGQLHRGGEVVEIGVEQLEVEVAWDSRRWPTGSGSARSHPSPDRRLLPCSRSSRSGSRSVGRSRGTGGTNGVVMTYWCCTETSGTLTPTVAASVRVHCPAQHTTTLHSMRPCDVTTALITPSTTSISSTSVSSQIVAPACRAPRASAIVMSVGLACPSVGRNAAPITSSTVISGHRSCASSAESRCISSPNDLAVVACRFTSFHRSVVARQPQAAVHLPSGGLSGLVLQPLVEVDRVAEQLGDVGAAAQLADETGSVERGARRELVPLDEHRVGPSQLGQVIGRRAPDDAAADDHGPSRCWLVRHALPFRYHSRV